MRFYRDSRVTTLVLVVFFALVIGYAYFETRGILYGPKITIPSQITLVHNPYVAIRGHVEHIAALTMNGRAIPVTEQGIFEEPYILAPGDNLIKLEARDKYGRATERMIEIVYQPTTNTDSSTPINPTTSTSPSTTTDQIPRP